MRELSLRRTCDLSYFALGQNPSRRTETSSMIFSVEQGPNFPSQPLKRLSSMQPQLVHYLIYRYDLVTIAPLPHILLVNMV